MAANFSLTGRVRLVPTWTEPLDLVNVIDRTAIDQAITFVDGDGAGEADCYWRDVRTVAANGVNSVNRTSLPLNTYGGTATLNMASIRLIYVKNKSATNEIAYQLGGDLVLLSPGGVFFWCSGNASAAPIVAPNTITIENDNGTSADYEIVLVGVKA